MATGKTIRGKLNVAPGKVAGKKSNPVRVASTGIDPESADSPTGRILVRAGEVRVDSVPTHTLVTVTIANTYAVDFDLTPEAALELAAHLVLATKHGIQWVTGGGNRE